MTENWTGSHKHEKMLWQERGSDMETAANREEPGKLKWSWKAKIIINKELVYI